MTDDRRLFLVRALHTLIYVVMASATLAVFWAGVTGARGPWLKPALILAGLEALVFAVSGMRCPLTAVVARYDPRGGETSDTFFPKAITRHTLAVFGPLLAIGVIGLLLRS